ncbi:MAG TPA: bpX6 domain-containing protein [Polyangia bacterium]|jgi:hypothetical protein|nr:bpX6 domain-containing protein [Polyangia bacterium]
MPRLFRGTVAATAFVFDERRLGPVEARRRVLAWWTPGAHVRSTEIGLVLVLPSARRVAVNSAPGLPLVANGGTFVGFETTLAEIRALGASAGSLVVVRAGRIEVVANGQDVSPHEWIALGSVAAVSTRALSEPRALALEPPAPVRALHEVLGPSIPPPAEERLAFLRDAGAAAGSGATGNVSSVASLFDWFRSLVRRKRRSTTGLPGTALAEREPSTIMARLREAFGRIQRWVGLQRLLGRRHGKYLADVMEMLAGGDVREGLRHAIPLASMKEIFDRRPAGLSWRLPSARSQLAISPFRGRSSSSLVLADDLFGQLRALYRRTFEQLDAQGRHEEAAFVLAELLQADEEAVAYLERNGQLRRAAELAEARGCAPGLVVRAWFIAGDRNRAVRIARERGAFNDAIVRLGKSHPEAARQLRWLWADSLAASGSYADAVELLHPVVEAQNLVFRWLELGLAADEAQAPRLLAFQAALAPERWAETRALAEVWLASQDDGSAARRRALAEALPKVPSNLGSRRLARLCARWIVASSDSDVPAISSQTIQGLIKAADDDALEADLPNTSRKTRQRWLEKGDDVSAIIEPRGPVPVQNAVVLSSGRLLVAQGEAGVVLLGRTGALLHRFDCPADGLIISDEGDRAIALASRGESTQLTQLDLPARTHRSWGLVPIVGGAKTYDGNVWFAHDGLRLMGIDTMGPVPRCFWTVDVGDEAVMQIVRSARDVVVLVGGWGMELWRYELPGPTLRERKPLKLRVEGAAAPSDAKPVVCFGSWLALDGTVYGVLCDFGGLEVRLVSVGASRSEVCLSPEVQVESSLKVTGATTTELFALAVESGPGAQVRLFDTRLRTRATFQFPQSKLPRLRFCGSNLVMSADGGRLSIFDTDRGALRTI